MKLTLPQQDVYFEQLLYPNDPIYNIGAKIEIKGPLSVELLKAAYVALIDQHDAYRAVFHQKGEAVEMHIQETHQTSLGFVDFSAHQNPEHVAEDFMQKTFLECFDLLGGELLHRFTLVKVREDFHYLFSVYHHIITDGWGTSLMFQRLVKNYNELVESGAIASSYPFSYQTFVAEDQAYHQSDTFQHDKAYWVEKFKHLPDNLFEKIEGGDALHRSRRAVLMIPRQRYNQMNELASRYRVSSFHLILACLYLYFGRKQQNHDFAIGLPVLNRSKRIYKQTVGLFMGISPLRMQLDMEARFEDLLISIKRQLRQDYRHQRFPLGKLIQELQVFGEKEKLFNITLSYEKQDYSHKFDQTQTRVIPMTHQSERVALALYIREFDASEDVKIDFDYNLNYFDADSIDQVVMHFEHLLKEVLANPERRLREFEYLPSAQRSKLLEGFNQTARRLPTDQTLLDLFESEVQERPHEVAAMDDAQILTYAELDLLSRRVASYLLATFGEEDRSPIALLLDRSVNTLAILLGIFRAGRSYIPLDPNFPQERLNYIVENSQTNLLIREKDYQLVGMEHLIVVELENMLREISLLDGSLLGRVSPEDTAYIIYTSGSTGQPKGVEIGHRSLLNFLLSMQRQPGMSAKDVLFSVTTYSFDISILEFFTPLISGAVVYIANQKVLSDPSLTIQKLQDVSPSILQATPSFYQMLFHAGWKGSSMLKILCGGDLLSQSLAAKLLQHNGEVWNMYGPTETTIWSSIKRLQYANEASNIGQPIDNTRLYILDAFRQPLPLGSRGAIFIAGDGLAKGYFRNETLTDARFVKDPFQTEGKMYETGDVGRWNAKGEIEFLGRNDNQVKVRGYRIELEDIETHLNQIPQIADSVVVVKKGMQQEASLIAYVKMAEPLETTDIIRQLQQTLPVYMIPHTIVPLDHFPLTPNQKVDRKSLAQRAIEYQAQDDYEAAQSKLEKQLQCFWQEVLDVDRSIGMQDNFFALGGHSLNAVKLVAQINEALQRSISLKTIFDFPTIRSLAWYLQNMAPKPLPPITKAVVKDHYPLTPSQHHIWLASQQEALSVAYNMAAAYSIQGKIDLPRIQAAMDQILKKYEIFHTRFVEIEGRPFQKIDSTQGVDFKLEVDRLSLEEAQAFVHRFVHQAFDLEKDLLLRVRLLQVGAEQFLLLFCTHHLIMDGWSLENFVRAFVESYRQADAAHLSSPLAIQFKDYSEWLNQQLAGNAQERLNFWKNHLQGYHHQPSFEPDFHYDLTDFRGDEYRFELTTELTDGLKQLARRERTTLYKLSMAAMNALIYKYSGHRDICLGTVEAGRNKAELNDQIGLFAKTLLLRSKVEGHQTFIDLLEPMEKNLLEIGQQADVPFDKLPRSLFDVLVVFQNPEFSFEQLHQIQDFQLDSYPIKPAYSRLPMVFNFYESEGQLKGIVTYSCERYSLETIQIIVIRLERLLECLIENPLVSLDAMQLLADFEREQAIDFNFNF